MCKMSRLLTVAHLLTIIVLVNFISGTFLVICGFTHWDIIASATTLILSACIVHLEATNKWSCIGKQPFTNFLIICILLGGASAFFWFFHMIYKIGHYDGDYSDMLWSTPTKLIAFVASVLLILRAHNVYTHLTLKSLEVDVIGEDATSLSKPTLFSDDGLTINIKKHGSPV